jgi:uncharacterized RDD family membrane protein YckC
MADGIGSIFSNPDRKDHWIKRGIAYIIDSVIITVIYIIIVLTGTMIFVGSVVGGAMTGNAVGGVFGGLLILFLFILIAIIFSIAYWIYFDAKGGTPGKKFMKLTPIALIGEMSYTKAAIRNGSKIVGGFIGGMIEGAVGIMLIGFLIELIIVFLDMYLGITSGKDPRQKYTDIIADTTVIRTDVQEDVEGMRYVPPAPIPVPAAPPPPISKSEPTLEPATKTEPETVPTHLSEVDSTTKEQVPEKKILSREDTVKKYAELFEINEERALELYKAGYKSLEDLKDAIVEDLILVDKINPTIARRIIKKMQNT